MENNNIDIRNVDPSQMKKGDVLWESGQCGSTEFIVKDDPTFNDGKWEWIGITDNGEVEYLITEGAEHYGPRIYKVPVYGGNLNPLSLELNQKFKERK